MGLEIALLESDPERGVRILGRTTDPDLIARVRDYLRDRLDKHEPERPHVDNKVIAEPVVR